MTNDLILQLGIIFVFIFVIIIQAAERFFYGEQVRKKEEKLLEENSRLVKAVIAKNANDYVMTTSIDKVAPEPTPPQESDLTSEDQLSDDEFFEAIDKQVNKKKN